MDKKQSGFMMMVIALMLVVFTGFATSYVAMIVSGANSISGSISSNSAYDIAKTGLEHGSYQLSLGACSSSWSSTVSASGGEYQYKCNSYVTSSTLSSTITATDTSIPLTNATTFANLGQITINSEVIYYSGVSGNTLLNARRGINGSASAYSPGVSVQQPQQYVVSSQAAVPSLSTSNGKVTLNQATSQSKASYYAVGAKGSRPLALSYNNSAWSIASLPSGGTASATLYYVDINSTYGKAVAYNASSDKSDVYTINNGTWTLTTAGATATNYSATACNKPTNYTDCWVGGRSTSPSLKSLLYHIGGSTYISTTINLVINGMSCSNDFCVAVGGGTIIQFPVASTTPFVTTTTGLNSTLTDVECLSATSCVVTSTSNGVYYYNGTTWTYYAKSFASNLNGVSCPASNTCYLAGDSGKIYKCDIPITAASTCTLQTLSSGSPNLTDVACNSTADCMAIVSGTQNYAYSYTGGGSWVKISLPAKYTLRGIDGTAGITSAGQVVPFMTISQ